MTTVTIHQPNYLPWLGYFGKIAEADVLVFLDDVQFSKNSYTNRVKVMGPSGPCWLSQPVRYNFGDPIDRVAIADAAWPRRHMDKLCNYYRSVRAAKAVLPRLSDLLAGAPQAGLAAVNRHLIEGLAGELGLTCRFVASSELAAPGASDDRLIRLVAAVDPTGTYLSGRGGAKYQDPTKFAAAGLGFRYMDFHHPVYDQGGNEFTPGLSVIDAVVRLGWDATGRLIRDSAHMA